MIGATQTVTGTIKDDANEALPAASIYWWASDKGGVADLDGNFEIDADDTGVNILIASYLGYRSDTLQVTPGAPVHFRLIKENDLEEVVIDGRRAGTVISSLEGIKVETLTQEELGKSACCDLAGCFETQVTVQPQTTNVITNAKELRILGLSGVYNQVLIDGFPMIQGLSYTYGISSVPGTAIENIYVAKGANSVLQGYESISGQINVELQDGGEADKFFFNLFANSFGETQYNLNYAVKKEKWNNITTAHVALPGAKMDRDDDNLLDLPLLTRYTLMNKWKYGDDRKRGWSTKIGVRYLIEERIGGQKNFDADTDKGSNSVYGQSVNIAQPDIWTKTTYRFDPQHKLSLFASGFYQDQESFFGVTQYNAKQTNGYASLQYDWDYTASNSFKAGASFRYLDIEEKIAFTQPIDVERSYDGDYHRREKVAGVFAEHHLQLMDDKIMWMAGIRADHHDTFGWKVTPRTLVKWNATPSTTIRANVGLGWRTVNLFSENVGLLASSRDIVIAEELKPEQAMNTGVNVTQKFERGILSGWASVDFYHTNFQNQIFPDYNVDATKAIVQNFEGTSISNGFQIETFVNLWEQFEVKAGYNLLDVYREVEGQKETLPFNPKHKVLLSTGYRPKSNRYQIDVHAHWYGEQRLPNTSSNPLEFQRPEYSEDYATFKAQFTYKVKRWDIYTGCSNIFDYRQKRPILSWENPFGQYFDTSSVWGPTQGREFYLGIRYKIEQ